MTTVRFERSAIICRLFSAAGIPYEIRKDFEGGTFYAKTGNVIYECADAEALFELLDKGFENTNRVIELRL